jgi:amylosucrase
VYDSLLHKQISAGLRKMKIDIGNSDNMFYTRFVANATSIQFLYYELYKSHPDCDSLFNELINTMAKAYTERPLALKHRDEEKDKKGNWFLSNELTGMSLYVDRFCGKLTTLGDKLD